MLAARSGIQGAVRIPVQLASLHPVVSIANEHDWRVTGFEFVYDALHRRTRPQIIDSGAVRCFSVSNANGTRRSREFPCSGVPIILRLLTTRVIVDVSLIRTSISPSQFLVDLISCETRRRRRLQQDSRHPRLSIIWVLLVVVRNCIYILFSRFRKVGQSVKAGQPRQLLRWLWLVRQVWSDLVCVKGTALPLTLHKTLNVATNVLRSRV